MSSNVTFRFSPRAPHLTPHPSINQQLTRFIHQWVLSHFVLSPILRVGKNRCLCSKDSGGGEFKVASSSSEQQFRASESRFKELERQSRTKDLSEEQKAGIEELESQDATQVAPLQEQEIQTEESVSELVVEKENSPSPKEEKEGN